MPNRQFNKALTGKTDSFVKELKRQDELDLNKAEVSYNWEQALEAMYTKNSSCRNATFKLDDAKTAELRYWRRFIPSLSSSVSGSTRIDDLASAFVDPTFRINSFLSLGNLLSMPKDIYTRKLGTIAAELNEQLIMRQQTIALFLLFEERRLWELQGEGLELNKQLLTAVGAVDSYKASGQLRQNESQIEAWQEKEEVWLKRVGDFYGVTAGQISLVSGTTPSIRYSSNDLDFYDTQRWGKLQMKLLALRDMGNENAIRNAYLDYLPRPSLTTSAPAIYSNTSDSNFSIKSIIINPRVSWQLDTTGSIGQQIKRLKRNKPFEDWEKSQRIEGEVRKLREGKKRLEEVEKELSEIKIAKQQYLELVRKNLVDHDVEKMLKTLEGLHTEEITLTAEAITISSTYWLMDEKWWSNHERPWKKKSS